MKILSNHWEIFIDGEGEVFGGLEVNGYIFATVSDFILAEGCGPSVVVNNPPPPCESYSGVSVKSCKLCNGLGVYWEFQNSQLDYDSVRLEMSHGTRIVCPNCYEIKKN